MWITNICVSGRLETPAKLNLDAIATKNDVFFKDEQTPLELFLDCRGGRVKAVKIPPQTKPRPCFLVFSSGAFILVGIRSYEHIVQAIRVLKRELGKAGYKVKKTTWTIENVNVAGRLDGFDYKKALKSGRLKKYKNFPGLVFCYPNDSSMTMTIYHTGNYIIAGIRGASEKEVLRKARSVVLEFARALGYKAEEDKKSRNASDCNYRQHQ